MAPHDCTDAPVADTSSSLPEGGIRPHHPRGVYAAGDQLLGGPYLDPVYTTSPWKDGAYIKVPEQVLAVALRDQRSLIIATADDVRVFDPTNGALTHLHHLPTAEWLQAYPQAIKVPNVMNRPIATPAHVDIVGYQGGTLARTTTTDGWAYNLKSEIGRVVATIGPGSKHPHRVSGAGDPLSAGFSPDDLVFVLWTTGGFWTAYRDPLPPEPNPHRPAEIRRREQRERTGPSPM